MEPPQSVLDQEPKRDLRTFDSDWYVVVTEERLPLPRAAVKALKKQPSFRFAAHKMLHCALYPCLSAYRRFEVPMLSFNAPVFNLTLQRKDPQAYSASFIDAAILTFNSTVSLEGVYEKDENVFKKAGAVSTEYYYRLFGKVYGQDSTTIEKWHRSGEPEPGPDE